MNPKNYHRNNNIISHGGLGPYRGCKWCYGSGCNQCDIQRKKDHEKEHKQRTD